MTREIEFAALRIDETFNELYGFTTENLVLEIYTHASPSLSDYLLFLPG